MTRKVCEVCNTLQPDCLHLNGERWTCLECLGLREKVLELGPRTLRALEDFKRILIAAILETPDCDGAKCADALLAKLAKEPKP